jgi:hypothetical protein
MNDGPVDPAHGLQADIGQILLHIHGVTIDPGGPFANRGRDALSRA